MTASLARHMIGAEILRLRRNRSLMAFALVLTTGVIVLFFGFDAIRHASNTVRYGPGGGIEGFSRAVRLLGLFFGALAATLVGGEAGTSDIASGVLRDLVATGRPRLALFAVRAPGAVTVMLALDALAFGLAVIATFVFAGPYPTPGAGLILRSAGWIALSTASVTVFAVAVGSATGSRAVTLTAVIGWFMVATPLLLNVSSLGSAREGLLTAGLERLMPVGRPDGAVRMASAAAVLTLLAWVVLPTALAAWRTQRRDA